MSNIINLVHFVIKEAPRVNHSTYGSAEHEDIVVDGGIFHSEFTNTDYHIFYTIFSPNFLKKNGGLGYFHHGRAEYVENTDFCDLFKKEIQKISSDLVTIGCVNGNEQNILSIPQTKFPNDFVYPDFDEAVLSDREPMPFSNVSSLINSISFGTYNFYNKINEFFPRGKNFILPPPPPINFDENYVQIYNEGFRSDAEAHQLNPLSIRKKIHKLYSDNLEKNVNNDFKFVYFPVEYLDDSGGLPIKLAQGVTHGNIDSAGIYFNQIERGIA